MQHRAAIKNLTFILNSIKQYSDKSLASRDALLHGLASLERPISAYRRWGELAELGKALTGSLLPESIKAIGHYYIGYSANPLNQGDGLQAASNLAIAAEIAPPVYRARALLSLAAQSAYKGDRDSELVLYGEAIEKASNCNEFSTAIIARRMLAIHLARKGDHHRAINALESLWPMVRTIQHIDPVIYFDWLNSIAVELSEVGRIDQACSAISIALNSPVAVAYPELHETAREIEQLESAPVIIVVPEIQPETQKPEKVLIILPVDNLSQASPKLLLIALAVVSISILICKSRPARAPPLF